MPHSPKAAFLTTSSIFQAFAENTTVATQQGTDNAAILSHGLLPRKPDVWENTSTSAEENEFTTEDNMSVHSSSSSYYVASEVADTSSREFVQPERPIKKRPSSVNADEIDDRTSKRQRKSSAVEEELRLVLGDGDFSFSKAFVERHPHAALRMTSTEYYDEKYLHTYADGPKNIAVLKDQGVDILFGVDATSLHNNPNFKDKKFKYIHFNCPHLRSGEEHEAERKLVSDFFKSAAALQNDSDFICMALPKPMEGIIKNGVQMSAEEYEKYTQGFVYNIREAATKAGYKYITKKNFDNKRYPGYQHRMTKEDKSTSKAASLREYWFKKTPKPIPLFTNIYTHPDGREFPCLSQRDTDTELSPPDKPGLARASSDKLAKTDSTTETSSIFSLRSLGK